MFHWCVSLMVSESFVYFTGIQMWSPVRNGLTDVVSFYFYYLLLSLFFVIWDPFPLLD